MRCFYLCTAMMALTLSSGSSLLACGDHSPPPQPVQQYVPQSQPSGTPLASTRDGLRLAGAGLGGAIVAGSIAWSMARRKV